MLEVIDKYKNPHFKNLYKHYLRVKLLFFFELIIGTIILSYFISLFNNGIYPGILTFAGPMFGAALILTGLTSSKISEINIDLSQKIIEIHKESLYSSKLVKVKFDDLRTELKSTNGKKHILIAKLKLEFYNSDKKVNEMTSNFLGINNETLRKLHSELKSIYMKPNQELTPTFQE